MVTVAVVALSFVLAWLTYRLVETPIRSPRHDAAGRRVVVAFGCLAAVAMLGVMTERLHGFLIRFPPVLRALLDEVPNEENNRPKLNSQHKTGPLVVTYGDSHSGHLLTGLRSLQDQRTFRLMAANWWICAPAAEIEKTPVQEEKCREIMEKNRRWFEGTKPDIVVLATSWLRFKHPDRLSETFGILREAGVGRIVLVGPVPDWGPFLPQQLLYRSFRANPGAPIPERIAITAHPRLFEMDRLLERVAGHNDVFYVSALRTLCNADGCLIRLGGTSQEIMQSDQTHFSPAGSRHFVSLVADQILGR
jgi:hypothetical protein